VMLQPAARSWQLAHLRGYRLGSLDGRGYHLDAVLVRRGLNRSSCAVFAAGR
jgi:hypothetical protein